MKKRFQSGKGTNRILCGVASQRLYLIITCKSPFGRLAGTEGIGLFHNDSQKNKLYVIYNELQPVASPLGGATAILVAGTTVKRDYYAQINHNIIQTGWGLNGIQLQNVMKYQLADNDIEMGNNALNDYGISVEGCNLVQVNCKGVYIYRIKTDKGAYYGKLVIQR